MEGSTVFVGSVPPDLNHVGALSSYFAQFGTIVNIQVRVEQNHAFVQFKTRAEAVAALDAPGHVLGDPRVNLNWANEKRGKGGGKGTGGAAAAGSGRGAAGPAGRQVVRTSREAALREAASRAPANSPLRGEAGQGGSGATAGEGEGAGASSTPVCKAPAAATPLSDADVAAEKVRAMLSSATKRAPPPRPAPKPAGAAAAAKAAAEAKAKLIQTQLAEQKALMAKLAATKKGAKEERAALMGQLNQLQESIKANLKEQQKATTEKPKASSEQPKATSEQPKATSEQPPKAAEVTPTEAAPQGSAQ